MKALLIIDMQAGLFAGPSPRYDAQGVIRRINDIARAVRAAGGIVIFIQHEDQGGLVPETEGWQILPDLERMDSDLTLRKQACDSFYETNLPGLLDQHHARELIITGCATDFCVDTTVRAAASRDYEVVVVEDGHTTRDRQHLDAQTIIRHHNYMWAGLILPRNQVKVMPASRVIDWLRSGS